MKKFCLLVFCALANLTLSAQGTGGDYLPDGIITTEWRFNPFSYEAKPTNMAQLNARMFLNAKSAVRLAVGFGYNKDKNDENKSINTQEMDANYYNIGNGTTTTTEKETSLKLALGYEYHFASIGRLDFYGGAEVGYLGRFYSATKESNSTVSNTSIAGSTTTVTKTTSYDNTEYKKSNADRSKFNEHGIVGSVFTGVDFYIYKKLYIGAELGVTFNMGKKANGTYEQNSGSITTVGSSQTANWTKTYSSETGKTVYTDNLDSNKNKTTANWAYENKGTFTKIYIEPAIRIGWMF